MIPILESGLQAAENCLMWCWKPNLGPLGEQCVLLKHSAVSHSFAFFFFFESRSHVAQAGFELTT